MAFSTADHVFMARALSLAARGRLSTHPNPSVGCVLVRDARVVGEGWHRLAGGPHAEVHALRAAGPAARGACCYVSLEPCCHHGRTPPCTDALIAAGVERVVAAMPDPNPAVAGRGLEALRQAGIVTAVGLMQREAERLNRGFVKRFRAGLPWLTVKMGVSADGRTASAGGESRWVTGEAARADVQRLRAGSGAVLTGIGTVLADDPRLTVREPALDTAGRQPLRVVVDSGLRTPAEARLLQPPGEVLIAHAGRASPPCVQSGTSARVDYLALPDAEGRVSLPALARALAERGVGEVLVEAGPRLAGALLLAGLVDELVLYVAPRLFGDAAPGLASLPGLRGLAEAPAFDFDDVRAVGADLRLVLRPRAAAG